MKRESESKPVYGDDGKYLKTLLEECKYVQKKIKMKNLTDDSLEKSESDSDSSNETESDNDNDEFNE